MKSLFGVASPAKLPNFLKSNAIFIPLSVIVILCRFHTRSDPSQQLHTFALHNTFVWNFYGFSIKFCGKFLCWVCASFFFFFCYCGKKKWCKNYQNVYKITNRREITSDTINCFASAQSLYSCIKKCIKLYSQRSTLVGISVHLAYFLFNYHAII